MDNELTFLAKEPDAAMRDRFRKNLEAEINRTVPLICPRISEIVHVSRFIPINGGEYK